MHWKFRNFLHMSVKNRSVPVTIHIREQDLAELNEFPEERYIDMFSLVQSYFEGKSDQELEDLVTSSDTAKHKQKFEGLTGQGIKISIQVHAPRANLHVMEQCSTPTTLPSDLKYRHIRSSNVGLKIAMYPIQAEIKHLSTNVKKRKTQNAASSRSTYI